jgi:hypothetical protein
VELRRAAAVAVSSLERHLTNHFSFLVVLMLLQHGHHTPGGAAQASRLENRGIRLVDYLDDFLILASPHRIQAHKQTVLDLFSRLGLEINLKKSVLEPSKIVEFLGLTLDLSGTIPKISAPANKRRSLLSDISRMLRDHTDNKQIQLVTIARLHGQIVHLYQAFPLLRALTFNISHQIAKTARHHLGWSAKNVVFLSEGSVADLKALPIELLTRRFEGRYLPVARCPPSFVITTDASQWGWAASLQQISRTAASPQLEPVNLSIQDRWGEVDAASHHQRLGNKGSVVSAQGISTDNQMSRNLSSRTPS